MPIDSVKTKQYIHSQWDSWYVAGLADFIRVPNLTPMVDPNYLTNGLVEQAIELVDSYINKLNIQGLSRTIIKNQKGVPLVCYVVEATGDCKKNMMMYGHLDKQPYGPGWDEDK